MATGHKTGGRKKGTANKVTKEIKEAYQQLINNNLDNLDTWIKDIAKDNPVKAMELIIKLSDFVLPKMKNIESTLFVEPEVNTEKTILVYGPGRTEPYDLSSKKTFKVQNNSSLNK